MTVQTFPVRFAETVNRFGTGRAERTRVDVMEPQLALVTLGDRSVVAKTYGRRVTRRGRQTLVSVHGRLTWVASNRVEPLGDTAAEQLAYDQPPHASA
ncbi:MAG TPA: hypothetical protein VFY11_03195 [Nocardioidaceae bacterium]|nr:hypothetical protein [Nocardioidaceae bacterium]